MQARRIASQERPPDAQRAQHLVAMAIVDHQHPPNHGVSPERRARREEPPPRDGPRTTRARSVSRSRRASASFLASASSALKLFFFFDFSGLPKSRSSAPSASSAEAAPRLGLVDASVCCRLFRRTLRKKRRIVRWGSE